MARVDWDCQYPNSRSVKPSIPFDSASSVRADRYVVLTVTVAVGVEDRPADAPQDGPWALDYQLHGNPSFAEAAAAISAFVFAYAGAPAFFPIASEMENPRQYSTALLTCQAITTAMYVTVGCVVYYYCGSYVASPALGSAGPLLKKICYGIAIPGLLMSAVLCLHVSDSVRLLPCS